LRDCLKVRQQKQPDVWTTFNTQSMLGGSLLGQKKYVDAESLLLEGYQGMKQREAQIPKAGQARLREAVDRLIELYDGWGKKDEAARWRALRDGKPPPEPPGDQAPADNNRTPGLFLLSPSPQPATIRQ
jgi:hypothetical protein